MSKYELEFNGDKNISINKMKKMMNVQKKDGVKLSVLKKDFGLSEKAIQEYENEGKLHFTIYGKTKYYNKEEVLKII